MTWGSFIVEETEACIANSVSKTCLLCAQPFLLRGWQCFRSLLRVWYSSWAIFSHPCIFAFSPTAQFSSVAQLCLTLCDLMDCSPSGSSVHGIFQARILECGLPFPPPGDLPHPGIEPGSPAMQVDALTI